MEEESQIAELLVPQPAEGLANLLETDVPTQTLPPLWHWVYLLERHLHSDLGPDGHSASSIPLPGSGRRRMAAGGRVTTYGELQIGIPAERVTRVAETKEKVGRSGPLVFVTVRHEISQGGKLQIVDESDIVYRPGGAPELVEGLDPTPLPERIPSMTLTVDEALLFRFSALTYNAHRIHYDHVWAQHEGYESVVVHGPLQALMMGELQRRSGNGLLNRTFAYRFVAPMIGPQIMHILASQDGIVAGSEVRDASGRLTARSEVTTA